MLFTIALTLHSHLFVGDGLVNGLVNPILSLYTNVYLQIAEINIAISGYVYSQVMNFLICFDIVSRYS